jgi:OOP family OmpA-OmpF porin
MTRTVFSTSILAATLLTGGCATKNYVRQTTAPIQAKVDQVGDQTNKQGQKIDQTQTDVKQVDDRAQTGISAAKEQAMTAQNSANDAASKAGAANDLANKDSQELADLRQTVSNLDDYKQVADVTIQFGFNRYALSVKDKEQLDDLVANAAKNKRFFIALEGFTDKVGSHEYNESLSRKRADAVAEYLVAKHDIPIYRIHMIGLADANPVDPGHGRDARAKNRRVEVKIYSADEATSLSQATGADSSTAQASAQAPPQ